MRLVCAFFALLLAVPAAPGQPCSPIRFDSLPVRRIAQSATATGSGVARQPDGDFTQHSYRRLRPGIDLTALTKGAVQPNLLRELFACSGQELGPLSPAAIVKPFAPLPGVSSTEILVTNLTGDNRPAFLAFDRFSAPDAVVVVIFDETSTAQSAASYPVGRSPFHVLAADFNGDGHTDVAVLYRGESGGNGGVSVLLGNGDGTLRAATNYVTGAFPTSATAGRFNGDDLPDIAVSHNNAKEIKILLAQAGGTFAAPATIATQGFPGALAAANINGDAFTDLVFSDTGGATVLFGNGAGGFGSPRKVTAGLNPFAVAAGDLNADGKTDLALGDVSGGVISLVLGDGAGGFGSARRYGGGEWPGALFISDFDRDGHADVVSATGHPDGYTWLPISSTIAVLRGRGDGTFHGSESLFGGNQVNSVVTADFNRDGNEDLAVARRGGAAVALGRGDGTFAAPQLIAIAGVAGPGGARQIAAGDLNKDNNPDLLVVTANGSSGANNVWTMLGNGDGTFRAPASTATVFEPFAVIAADLNKDGADDAIVLGSNGFRNEHGFAVHLAGAGGVLGAAQKTLFANTVRPAAMAVGDANSDGALDLFVVDNGALGGTPGGVLVLKGNGNGGFGAATNLAAGANPRAVTPADVNGDSILDLLVTTGVPDTFSSQLLTIPGKAGGTFGAPESRPVEFGPGEIVFEDFSGDGIRDLILMHCCGGVSAAFLLGKGGGAFDPGVSFFGGQDPVDPAVADFNRDGLPDLAIAGSTGGTSSGVIVLLNVANSGPQRNAAIAAVINAASGVENPLAPGEFITIYGENLGPVQFVAGFGKGLGGTRVFVNGVECFLTFTSATQVNAVLTAQLPTAGAANVVVEYGGVRSAPKALALAPASPGIFTQEFGPGQAWVVNQDGSFNSAANPAARGSFVAFFATGQGVTDPALADGEQPVPPVFPAPVLEVTVTIGGQPVSRENIAFAGLIFGGVLQLNLKIPDNAPAGAAQQLILSIGGAPSRQGVTMAVQ